MVEVTVNATVSCVAQTFSSNHSKGPILDRGSKTFILLQEQYIGFKNQYRATKNQRSLPALVLISITEWESTTWYHKFFCLFILALLLTIWSWRYLTTIYPKVSKRENILRLRNITFKKYRNVILHSKKLDNLQSSKITIIAYEFQKNKYSDKTVHIFITCY